MTHSNGYYIIIPDALMTVSSTGSLVAAVARVSMVSLVTARAGGDN